MKADAARFCLQSLQALTMLENLQAHCGVMRYRPIPCLHRVLQATCMPMPHPDVPATCLSFTALGLDAQAWSKNMMQAQQGFRSLETAQSSCCLEGCAAHHVHVNSCCSYPLPSPSIGAGLGHPLL